MTLQQTSDAPLTSGGLARTLAVFRANARMDMAFGGRVLPNATGLEITELCGARTTSLAKLIVRNGAGLGGKSLMLRRPVSVMSYHSAQGITHVYDHAVGAEHLETVVALPVVVDSLPRLVVYLGNRTQVGLGDRWFDSFTPLLRRLERDIAVDDEVRRRLALMRPAPASEPAASGLTRADMQDIAQELADLADAILDDALRARVEHVRSRFTESRPPTSRGSNLLLAPREIDVLTQIALGHSNKQAADNLGLLPNTVKSYLKTAMRKLHATNRVQAITAARQAGLIL
jgi:DNA-binding CsgD family transcriptional regulator